MVYALTKTGGKYKDGPSAKELFDDKIYEEFAHASALKNLFSLINKAKKNWIFSGPEGFWTS